MHYAQEMTPEELFEMFFGAARGRQARQRSFYREYRMPREHHEDGPRANPGIAQLLQFAPLLMVILFSWVLTPSSDSSYFRLVGFGGLQPKNTLILLFAETAA